MKLLQYIFICTLILTTNAIQAQSVYLTPGGKEEWLLNRLEIKTRTKQLSFSNFKPLNRKWVVNEVDKLDSLYATKDSTTKHLTELDKYNMQRLLMANSEWSKPKEIYIAEKSLIKGLYVNRANMIDKRNSDFILIANPIFNFQQGSKAGNTQSTFINQRGVNVRGIIGNKIGFYFYFTENQERQPTYVQDWRNKFIAVPGAGYIKNFKVGGFDYFDVRGGVTWQVAKFMDMQLAYDRNFIGNGYRSLFLSDFSTNNMFVKVNTYFGKFKYQNIFSELVSYRRSGSDRIYPRKYFRASYLSYQPTRWLNIGLFEGVMLGKRDKLSLPLFNPIMYTSFSDNKNDKSYVGFDAKLNIAKRIQVYSQFMVDKLKTDELKNDWWGNRFGYQIGVKYIDAFGVKNLDVQVETNVVRPFMYASTDSFSSYNHYNQPLAHPLGANFKEYIGIVRYQATKPLYFEMKLMLYKQGLDSAVNNVNQNFGSNIFSFNQTRSFDNGWKTTTGDVATCTMVSFLASYELKENLFFDVSYMYRNFDRMSKGVSSVNMISAGFRWNIGRREFLF
ncbi:MAG: hypothetical protein KBF36_00170 [Chitinophagaceae bacterium]|nr:hypothetical protein [Chitinophagaceae bacterium]MBP9740684.1 hypothetical protein [Chitinophagaceae bacterium]